MATTVWRGFVTFGLVSVPARLFRAARAERVSLRRLYRAEPAGPKAASKRERDEDEDADETGPEPVTHAKQPTLMPLQQASVQKGTDEIVPEKQVVKGFEYDKGRFVAIESEELKNIAPRTATEMEIQEFIHLSEIDPVYFETSYYVTPEEAGQKAYALLYKALVETQLVALAQVAMHGREHVVVLRPGKSGLIAHTMFFASEVRADDEYRADTSAVSKKEMELAETLIRSLAGPFEPEKYHDRYREKLEEMIAQKVKGQPIAKEEAPMHTAAVVDIAEALRKSLQNLKKPVASDKQARKTHTVKKARAAAH